MNEGYNEYLGAKIMDPVEDSMDLDYYTQGGIFCFTNNADNCPSTHTDGGYLIVLPSVQKPVDTSVGQHEVTVQIWMDASFYDGDNKCYYRVRNSTIWSGWCRFVQNADTIPITDGGTGANSVEKALYNLGLLYKKGDVAVFSNFTWPGLLTGGGKDIVVNIHFSKLLASDITKASIQSGKVIVRQNGNYIIGTATEKKDIASTFASTALSLSIDNTNDTERIGYMKLSLSSSPKNATNNDVVSVAFYELKVKFA